MTYPFLRAREAPEGPPRDYPPLPEALVVPVYDNHTHLEIADGGEPLDYREHLDRASSVGVRGVVQVGTDLATSRWSAEIAALEPRVLAAVALHPNEAPELLASGLLGSFRREMGWSDSAPRGTHLDMTHRMFADLTVQP